MLFSHVPSVVHGIMFFVYSILNTLDLYVPSLNLEKHLIHWTVSRYGMTRYNGVATW